MIVRPLPDQADRDAAVAERARNVVIDAGAGTGKTETLVRRVVALVAPPDDGPALTIDRVAAITFTRRAAGELAFRIRQHLIEELRAPGSATRGHRLRDALAGLDAAAVGTIHGFCDRLLRRHPVEARLSASYDIAEDTSLLVAETVDLLLRGMRNGTLAHELGGYDEILADTASETLRDFTRCGLRLETLETEYRNKYGLDALVEAFVRTRDVPPVLPDVEEFRLDDYRGLALEFRQLVSSIAPQVQGEGVRWLRNVCDAIGRVERVIDPVVLYAEIASKLSRRQPLNETARRADLGDDDRAWLVWQMIVHSNRQTPPRPTYLRDDLLAPLTSWLAHRLVNLQPVVVAAYDVVKRRRRQLDQLDLLLQLRNLLRDRRDVRARLQSVFDHILVDEFQDTDPLQAEVLLYLCEDGATATTWTDVRPRAGCATVVGDPQQSIYRFRRADIQMYADVTQRLADAGAARFTLSASLRSDPALVRWFNARFSEILELPPDPGVRFDAESGRAYYQPLTDGRLARTEPSPRVHVIPIETADSHAAEDYRRVEAEALAHYLRWLVEESGERIPVRDGAPRRITWGDIAILGAVTTNVGMLFAPFDAHGIPYVAAGGRLFLQDDLHRRFLLGLRALADRDDGVAEAALLRPPFFALDPSDVTRARAADGSPEAARAAHAVELVRELRRRRFERAPGETARDVLERSAIGREVALGPNGAQRLDGLRELCATLERIAAQDRLDYDAATAVLREWVESPGPLDPPAPVGQDTVRILTIHQAKGLEFPVVVMWDCRGTMSGRTNDPAWVLSRDGDAWSLSLDKLSRQEPEDANILAHEREYENTQRERLTYVAATRARDLLVLPCAGHPDEAPGRGAANATNRRLIEDSPAGSVHVLPPFVEGEPPEWAAPPAAPLAPVVVPATADASIEARWRASHADAARPRLAPRAVSVEAHAAIDPDLPAPAPAPRRPSRFGPDFGTTVHRAIGLALRDGLAPAEAVRRAACSVGLTDHLPDAIADVERTLATLEREGLARRPGADLRLEYPVAAPSPDGTTLLVGSIDLVAQRDDDLVILDFKSDAFIEGDTTTTYPEYARQLDSYRGFLAACGGRHARRGLLFTQAGQIAWLP